MVVDPQIPWERGRIFLKIQGWSDPPIGCGWVHHFIGMIAYGFPRYSRETGFLRKLRLFFICGFKI
jgi:hypothetical protein